MHSLETIAMWILFAAVGVLLPAFLIFRRKYKRSIATLQDEQRNLETQLSSYRDSEAQNATIADMQTDLVTRFTQEGILTYVNHAYCEFVGDVKENLVGTPLDAEVPEEEARAMKAYFNSFSQANPTQKNENRLRRRDGEFRDFEWSNFAQFDAQGHVAWFQSVGRDITERKRTQAALKASEARYYAVVDGQAELITRFRPDGHFTFVNGAYCRFCGRPEEAVLQSTIFEDVPKDEIERLKAYLASFSPDNPIQEIENRLLRHDGEFRYIEWRDTAYFDDTGKIYEYQSVARDVTEQKKALIELERAKEKAQIANVAKSNFLSTMSHEIRTPLNGVLGLAQLLMDTNLDADQRKKVVTILSSGQTLLAIINDVLDMSKIEAGGLELEETAFSIQELVSTIATPFQSLADDKELKLNVTNEMETNVILMGDPVRLRQILWNLLSNAIKFTRKGHVTLSIKEAAPSDAPTAVQKDTVIVFSVSDTGTGIAPERLDSIFDAFTQEDNSITRKFGGTGLGLSIVSQLTEMMGGIIDVESEMNSGTSFTVRLPFFSATKEESEKFYISNPQDKFLSMVPFNILLAEDNAVNAMIAKAFLEKFGHHVRHVENGKEAVDVASEGWADLILMDIHMPEMDGIEATKLIRTVQDHSPLPIIGLTAEAFTERHTHFKDAGMNDVLTKPFTEQQLVQILTQYGPNILQTHSLPEYSNSDGENHTAPSPVTVSNQLIYDQTTDARLSSLPIGDDEKLSWFRDEMPPDMVFVILDQAANSMRQRIAEIRQGIDTSNITVIRDVARSLKGASGSLYAIRVAALASFIEQYAEDSEMLMKLMPKLERTAEKTIDWWHSKSDEGHTPL